MERASPCRHQNNLPSQFEQEIAREGMRQYLKATRPAFEEALRRSKELGFAANGLLAGPSLTVKGK